ncbi:uncharacterized protein [Hemitrygon akajei]|uniref:uncharacterized protein n=1 Tax=Hemitrygon akajei TaxID=2704970 RepID=UPI003BF95C5C
MALQAFRKLKDILLKNYSNVLKIGGNGAIAAVLYGLEEMLEKISPCPCHPEWNATHAVIVFTVPAVILYMFCLVVYPDSRRVLKCGPGCTLPRGETDGCCKTCCTWNQCGFATMTLLKTGIPSVLWIVIVFLDGSYYTCSKVQNPNSETCKNYCSSNNSPDVVDHCSKSRMIGAILLAATVTLLVLLYFLPAWKCGDCTVERYYEAKYQKMLEKEKRTKTKEELEKEAKEFAEESAKQVIGNLKLGKPVRNVQQSNTPPGNEDDAADLNPNPNAILMMSVH